MLTCLTCVVQVRLDGRNVFLFLWIMVRSPCEAQLLDVKKVRIVNVQGARVDSFNCKKKKKKSLAQTKVDSQSQIDR